MMSNDVLNIFVTCPLGVQYVLEKELLDLGLFDTKAVPAGVSAHGSLESVYRALLWSSTANRVLLVLHEEAVDTPDDIYLAASKVPWGSHFSSDKRFAVSFSGTNRFIKNSTFGAMRVKDAIADYFRDTQGVRPDVDRRDPDIQVAARLAKGRLSLSIDLSGESLHKRGYRSETGEAPLKENLACAVLKLSGWPSEFESDSSLVDPMCGSGTFLIEAAQLATDFAPGLRRLRWGFDHWSKHQSKLWEGLLDEANGRYQEGLSNFKGKLIGFDQDSKVVRKAWRNIQDAGFEGLIHVEKKAVEAFELPESVKPGLVVTNPPYGDRLGEKASLTQLYSELGAAFEKECTGWKAAVFTGEIEFGKAIGWRSHKQYKLFNGAIESVLLKFNLDTDRRLASSWLDPERMLESPKNWKIRQPERARMFENRVQKNLKQLSKWAKKQAITCFRIYDADIPEFAVAVDQYEDLSGLRWLHVQEYAAPSSIDEKLALERLSEALSVLKSLNECDGERVVLKTRRIQKGAQQYNKVAERHESFNVSEADARFEINLHDYLDTGLFLDHRPLRRWIRANAQGKTCLNLFCYTSSLSVAAALAGGERVDSIDMSNTYLDWSKRNFETNGLDTSSHGFIHADCVKWLEQEEKLPRYDLIFLDPPSFSNSKRMEGVLDVQRDHASMIEHCMGLLTPGGVLVFSNNLRKFKLDATLSERYSIQNWHRESLDKDFERNSKIHQCWMIQAMS